MNPTVQRKHPRVSYGADLHLVRRSNLNRITARAIDLGEGGLGVQCVGGWAVGVPVECELKDEQGLFKLPGQIIWAVGPRDETKTQVQLGARDTPKAVELDACMGVRFDALDQAQTKRLAALVRHSPPLESPVELELPGLGAPVRARARMTDAGLELRTALPFLRIGEAVGVRFARELEPSRATLQTVTLDCTSGTPELAVTIGLGPQQAALQTDDPEPPSDGSAAVSPQASQVQQAADHAPDPSRDVDAPRLRLSAPPAPHKDSGRRFSGLAMLLCLLLGAAAGAWVTESIRAGDGASALPAALTAKAALPPANALSAPTTLGAEQSPSQAERTQAPPEPTIIEPAIHELAIHEPAVHELAFNEPAIHEPAIDEPAINEPPSTIEPPGDGPVSRPVVDETDTSTRIFVPLHGDTSEMRSYALSSPGLLIELPHAQSDIPLDNYGVHRKLVRRVWLRQAGPGIQVRIIFLRPPSQHAIRLENGGLVVELRP